MPLLAKEQSSVSALADAETPETPCEKIAKQTVSSGQPPQTTGNEITNWIDQAKNSPWLPWAVAGGFALLWINKSK